MRGVLLLCAAAAMVMSGAECAAQPFPIFNGTANTCMGALLDTGGEGAGGYSNNENITYTICPDSPNDAISLTFLTFNLSTAGAAPVDQMTIHDGSSTAAPTLGTYTGTGLQGLTVLASPLNNTGCLTIVFRSNNTGTGVFAASISCYTPCQRPTAVATMNPAPPVRICIGESVNFNGSGSFAAPGFSIASRTWDFGDGTVQTNAAANVSHTYTQAGEFITQLYLVDNNGCASSNRVDLPVQVGTEPDFLGTQGELLGCTGQTLCLDGIVNATTWNALPGNDLGGGVFLPDDVGSCFISEITYTQFAPGQTLNNVNDLLSICASMEHSFMGDLVINIISPTGQVVTMHQQGGGGTFLGVPVDNDGTPNIQGDCWEYCWSPTATNGTWVANAGGTLPSGTYASLNPLSGLVGSQLNGTWGLQICDLWGSDNGFLCSWNIDFNPAIFPDLTEFTPVYGAGADSSSWTGPHITSTSANGNNICVTPPAPGNYSYIYSATDNFGCTYDTTLTVTILPPPTVSAGVDATTCGTPVNLSASVTAGGLPGSCVYALQLFDTFGDGWDGGANVTVTVNGIASTYTLGNPPGNQTTINVPVAHGQTISLSFQAGTIWNNENRFELRNSAGTILYNSGTGPSTGQHWTGVAVCPPEPFLFSWSPSAGLSDPNIANPTATIAATTTYCVTAYQPSYPNCTATDCMTITVDSGVDAGTNGSTAVCANGSAFDLFPLLGGSPTAGGSWTAPDGTAHSGNFIPGADAAGVYTYTIIGSAACGSTPETSTVTVAVSPLPNAGANTTLSLCTSSAPVDLLNELGGTPDPGGSWSGPSALNGSVFDPATMSQGTYTYTVPGTAPCPSASSTVQISVSIPPNAFLDGTLITCASSNPQPLFIQLGGTPDGGGTWSGPSVLTGGVFNPATMNAGVYSYTVAGTAPCPNESADVTVTINTPPNAGLDGAITLCSSDAATSLFAQLGGTPDAGGTWSGPSTVVGGMIDPATMNAGVYTYT
ncbi:MAG TPA: PKD domain-containing protein, partial [Flavobacteriales bacterium]|nr:PKD domain-containing protein [Flavobacteriales bacterium]